MKNAALEPHKKMIALGMGAAFLFAQIFSFSPSGFAVEPASNQNAAETPAPTTSYNPNSFPSGSNSGSNSVAVDESDNPLSSPTAADEDPVGDYIGQFRGPDGRLQYQQMAQNLQQRGDTEFAAEVVARIAYASYVASATARPFNGWSADGANLVREFSDLEFVREIEVHLSGNISTNPIWSQYDLNQYHRSQAWLITYAVLSSIYHKLRGELEGGPDDGDSEAGNSDDSSANQNPRSEAQALVAQYRGRNGVVRYAQLAQAILDLTTRRGATAARVLAELAVASYRRSGRVNTELISFLDNFNLLRRIRSIFGEGRFWRTYDLSPTELQTVRSAFQTRINEQTVQTLIRHHDGVYTPDRQRLVFHHRDGVVDLVGTYDVRNGNYFSRSLEGVNGYRGIRGVTPDGNYALVASRTNAGVYVVPLYTVNNFGPQFFSLPSISEVAEVSFFRGQTTVRIRLQNGREYLLNYLTGQFREDTGRLSRA